MAKIMQQNIKIKSSSSIKCTYQYQQSNPQNLQKIKDRFDEGYNIDLENRTFLLIWKILKILKTLMSTLYLMLSPLILVIFSNDEGNKYVA